MKRRRQRRGKRPVPTGTPYTKRRRRRRRRRPVPTGTPYTKRRRIIVRVQEETAEKIPKFPQVGGQPKIPKLSEVPLLFSPSQHLTTNCYHTFSGRRSRKRDESPVKGRKGMKSEKEIVRRDSRYVRAARVKGGRQFWRGRKSPRAGKTRGEGEPQFRQERERVGKEKGALFLLESDVKEVGDR